MLHSPADNAQPLAPVFKAAQKKQDFLHMDLKRIENVKHLNRRFQMLIQFFLQPIFKPYRCYCLCF